MAETAVAPAKAVQQLVVGCSSRAGQAFCVPAWPKDLLYSSRQGTVFMPFFFPSILCSSLTWCLGKAAVSLVEYNIYTGEQ